MKKLILFIKKPRFSGKVKKGQKKVRKNLKLEKRENFKKSKKK